MSAPLQIPLTLAVALSAAHAAPLVEIKGKTRLALDKVRLTGGGEAEVSGQLVDKLTGEGLPNQSVAIIIAGQTVNATTDNQGKFTVHAPVPPGQVAVELRFRGAQALDKADLTTTTDPSRAQVTLAMTSEDTPDGASILVSASADDQLVRVPVEVGWATPTGGGHANSAGLFTGQKLSLTRRLAGGPGPYHLTATYPGDSERQPARTELSIELTSTTTTTATANTAQLPFEDELTLSGKITDADGTPLAAAVTLLAGDKRLAQGISDKDGKYALSVEGEVLGEGNWGMQVAAEPGKPYLKASKSTPIVVRVAAPQPVPVSYTIIAFLATAVAAGGFFLSRAQPWKGWKLRRRAPADVPVEAAPVEALEGGLVTGKPTLAATLRRPHDDGFAGVVRDTVRGRPVGEGVVRLLMGELEREIRTAADGSFAIEGLSPGEWRAEVAAPGHVTETFEVSIPHRGELRGVRIDLVPVRERVFQLYKLAAEPVLPEPRLWGIWSPRQIVDHVRARRPSPAMVELTDFVEEIYFSGRLAAEGVLPGTSERVDKAIQERRT